MSIENEEVKNFDFTIREQSMLVTDVGDKKMGQFCLNSVAESCNYKSQHYDGIFFCSKAMKVANFQQQKDCFRVFYDTVETISGVKRSSGVNSTI